MWNKNIYLSENLIISWCKGSEIWRKKNLNLSIMARKKLIKAGDLSTKYDRDE